jgi:hypothetical protein
MHERYGSKGVVCMSVSVDPEDNRASALKFLTQKKATFANYWLDEPDEFWQARWKIKAPPAMFVFDRQGRRVGKFDSEDLDKPLKVEDIEKVVKQLLGP